MRAKLLKSMLNRQPAYQQSPLPAQKQAPVKAAAVKQKTIRHKVKKGETLEKIAGMYNVSIADIKKWNKLSTSRVLSGTKIKNSAHL